MKIYIALFTTLIAAGHFTNVSAADATASVDGASHPHLRALADAAVDGPCDDGKCNTIDDCGCHEVCTGSGGSDCSGVCDRDSEAGRSGCTNDSDCGGRFCTVDDESGCNGVCCPGSDFCDSNGQGCPSGTTCDLTGGPWVAGCYDCYPTEAGLAVGGNEEAIAVQDEDEIEVSSLRASILKEE